jgi:hypothetical protein
MYKVGFSQQAERDLFTFINNYEAAFFELYRDSGLWNEKLIIQSYRDSAVRLLRQIIKTTEQKLQQHNVIGRKKLHTYSELNFHVGTRLVTIFYHEEPKHKTRMVISIGIDRKPLIF